MGIAFDEHGFPLAHETFEGNMGDTKTLPIILDRLARHEQGLKPVVILDAGFASRANLALLKERGYSYLVNITRSRRTKYATPLKKQQCGDAVLKTDKSLKATQLWELYITILKTEAGFRQLKGTLGLRPNFHQLEDCVDGYMLMLSPPAYGTLRAA